jgi:hypothetical protein
MAARRRHRSHRQVAFDMFGHRWLDAIPRLAESQHWFNSLRSSGHQ